MLFFVLCRREQLPTRATLSIFGWLLLASAIGAKLFSLLIHGVRFPLELELYGGLRHPGTVLGILLAGFLLRTRLPAGLTTGRLFDLYAAPLSLSLALGRIGCFLNGCCHGTVTESPLAVTYPARSLPWLNTVLAGDIPATSLRSAAVHPLQLYMAAVELALCAICLWLLRERRLDGFVMLVFLAVHGSLVSLLEFWRFEYHPLHHTLFVTAAGAVFLLWSRSGPTRTAAIYSRSEIASRAR